MRLVLAIFVLALIFGGSYFIGCFFVEEDSITLRTIIGMLVLGGMMLLFRLMKPKN